MASDEPVISQDMILGEMRGQLREVVHTLNNQTVKLDALAREVVALGPLAADISDIKARVAKLEATDNQQSGGAKLALAVLHSPVLMWVVVMAGIIWADVTGHIRP